MLRSLLPVRKAHTWERGLHSLAEQLWRPIAQKQCNSVLQDGKRVCVLHIWTGVVTLPRQL